MRHFFFIAEYITSTSFLYIYILLLLSNPRSLFTVLRAAPPRAASGRERFWKPPERQEKER